MQYTFVSQKDDKRGKTVTLHVAWDEIEKAAPNEVDNFVDGMKKLLGAVLPYQSNTSDGIDFNFVGCSTPENLKKK